MPNFSSLAGLEVAEKFLWGVGGWGGVGWGGLHSNFHVKPNRCVVLCWGWGFDNNPDQVSNMYDSVCTFLDHMYTIPDPMGTTPDLVYNFPNSMYTILDPKCTIHGPM